MPAKNDNPANRIAAANRRARFNYEIGQTYEAGVALTGTEVKSLREGRSSIADAYAGARGEELWLYNAYIPEYLQANRFNQAPAEAAPAQARDRSPDVRRRPRGDDPRAVEDLLQRSWSREG